MRGITALALFLVPLCSALAPAGRPAQSRGRVAGAAAATDSAVVDAPSRTVRAEKPLGVVLEEVAPFAPGVRVRKVKPDGCMARSGVVNTGDVLIAINGQDCKSKPLSEVLALLTSAGHTLDVTFSASSTEVTSPRANGETATSAERARRRSVALPWALWPEPLALTNLPADAGFDPLSLATDQTTLVQYREAEVKHGRLAMLGTVGWVAGELFDEPLASLLGMPAPIVENGGLTPSLLNGGLTSLISPVYWFAIFLAANFIESTGQDLKVASMVTSADWVPGTLGFDPLGLYPTSSAEQKNRLTAEIVNGRIAMVSITAMALQEAMTGESVVHRLAAAATAAAS